MYICIYVYIYIYMTVPSLDGLAVGGRLRLLGPPAAMATLDNKEHIYIYIYIYIYYYNNAGVLDAYIIMHIIILYIYI